METEDIPIPRLLYSWAADLGVMKDLSMVPLESVRNILPSCSRGLRTARPSKIASTWFYNHRVMWSFTAKILNQKVCSEQHPGGREARMSRCHRQAHVVQM